MLLFVLVPIERCVQMSYVFSRPGFETFALFVDDVGMVWRVSLVSMTGLGDLMLLFVWSLEGFVQTNRKFTEFVDVVRRESLLSMTGLGDFMLLFVLVIRRIRSSEVSPFSSKIRMFVDDVRQDMVSC